MPRSTILLASQNELLKEPDQGVASVAPINTMLEYIVYRTTGLENVFQLLLSKMDVKANACRFWRHSLVCATRLWGTLSTPHLHIHFTDANRHHRLAWVIKSTACTVSDRSSPVIRNVSTLDFTRM
jgi:hypothetical protein